MPSRLPTRSQKCRETRSSRAALLTRLSGRSRLLRNDPSTISSPATAAADPDKPGRPRSDRQPHNHSPPALTRARVQISITLPTAGSVAGCQLSELTLVPGLSHTSAATPYAES